MKSIVYTFGRFQPFTCAHSDLVNRVMEYAKSIGSEHTIGVSHVCDIKRNPLAWKEKVDVILECHPAANIFNLYEHRTPFKMLQYFADQKYDRVIMCVGGDRLGDFQSPMAEYASIWGIDEFEVINVGDRNANADDVTGICAENAREYAVNGEYSKFRNILPQNLSNDSCMRVYTQIRKAMMAATMAHDKYSILTKEVL